MSLPRLFPGGVYERQRLAAAAAPAKSLQSCPTLCDPTDCSPPGSPILGIHQARILEWGAISFSNAWKWKVKVKSLSHVQLFATPWTAAYQAPPSMGFSRGEYWSGVPLPSPQRLATYSVSVVTSISESKQGAGCKFHNWNPPICCLRKWREEAGWLWISNLEPIYLLLHWFLEQWKQEWN